MPWSLSFALSLWRGVSKKKNGAKSSRLKNNNRRRKYGL
jgi:hypothetical protein